MTVPYETGTVSVTAGSAVITGVGTAWKTALIVGGLFGLDSSNGNPVPIESVESDTQITLAKPWRGTTASGHAYWIIRDTDNARQAVANASALAQILMELRSTAVSALARVAPEAGSFLSFGANGNIELVEDANDNLSKLAALLPLAGGLLQFGANGSVSTALPADIRFDAKLSDYLPTRPIYIPHRGGAMLYPENTVGAYLAALSSGQKVIELDVWRLSDGTGGVFHDSTVDRITTSAGNVVNLNRTSFKALYVDAENWHGANVPRMNETLMIDEALTLLNGRAILVIEAKNTGSGAVIVNALQAAGVSKHHVIVQAFTQAELTAAINAGYDTMILSSSGTGTLAAAKAAGVKWAGLADATTNADVATWIGQGFKVVMFTITRRWRRDQLLALGVTGMFVDDPLYVATDKPFASADQFAAKTWMPGMVASDEGLSALSRGRFLGQGYWGWGDVYTTTIDRQYVLQGWAGPIGGKQANTNWSATFTVRFGAREVASNWFGVFIAADSYKDRPFRDNGADTEANGYNLLMRADGRLAIFKVAAGVGTNLAQTATGTIPGFPAAGGEGTFRIRVTATAIRISRINADGSELGFVEATDNDYRGGYIHFGRSAGAVSVRDVRVIDGGIMSLLGGTDLGDIVESGSNANGDYVRFSNGLQICTALLTTPIEVTQSRNGMFSSAGFPWMFPAAFAVAPKVFPSVTYAFRWATADPPSLTGVQFRHFCFQSETSTTPNTMLFAVGMWQ